MANDFNTNLLIYAIKNGGYFCAHILGPYWDSKYRESKRVDAKIIVPVSKKEELYNAVFNFAKKFWSDDCWDWSEPDDYSTFFFNLPLSDCLILDTSDDDYMDLSDAEYQEIPFNDELIFPDVWLSK